IPPLLKLTYTQERKMQCANLTAVAINADTVEAAYRGGRDLFKEVQNGVTIIILSPDQLKSHGFGQLIDFKIFSTQIAMMGVDKSHLLNSWGQQLRPTYQQIGSLQAQNLTRPPLLATTATLQKGRPTQSVCKFLGLQDGYYHFICQSNLRSDIQIIFREMQSGMASTSFPELDWVL
ncbi:hypothetical protein SERLA73DRAFT_41998, partial [Serpula lacrymans var. lacrymans S7.3]